MNLLNILLYSIVGVIGLILYLWQRQLNYWKKRGIPHDKPHPLYGNLKGFRKTKTLTHGLIDYYFKFKGKGPFVGFYNLMRPNVFVMDMQLAKNILIKDFQNFADRGVFYNEKDDPLSAHLFSLDGNKWKKLRSKITPTFTSGKMKFMYPTIMGVCERFIDVFGEFTERSNVVEIKELLARFTTDVIGTCAFGIECNSLRDPNAEFRIMGRTTFEKLRHPKIIFAFIQSFPVLARKLRMRFVRDDVHNFFMRIVRETVTLREQSNIRRNDFMDILVELKNKKSVTLENGEVLSGLTMDEVAAQAFVFFIAGFETSSTTMGFALYELALNQDIQDKLRTEVNEMLRKHDGQLTYECIKDMKYLDQIICETLRLYTIVPQLNRLALKDYVVPGHPKYIIEKGMQVLIPACAIHRDPDYYPNPEKFDPNRFSPEMTAKRDSVEWLPFGDGPRNCIGMRFGQMQSRVGLAMLVKNFKFDVCSETAVPIVLDPESFLLGAKGGIHLKVEKI